MKPAPDNDPPPSFSPAKRWSIAFHEGLSVIAALAIVVMLNYLAHRHDERVYLSRAAAQKLTPLTLQVLAGVTNKIKAIVFFDRREPLFGSVSSLIKEYQAHCPFLEVEFIDYRMPGRAEAVRNQYKLALGAEGSRVIFDANGQVRTVMGSELSEYGVNEAKEIRRTGFKGEQLFTSAIANLTQAKPVTAYYLQGHGEHDAFGGQAESSERGYSRFVNLLRNNNVDVKPLPALLSSGVPSDCGLLVIAGPEHPFETQEILALEKYLNQGGRMFVLFNAAALSVRTGLEDLLGRWNVEVGLNRVQDPRQTQAGDVIVASKFGVHPIVRPLLRSSIDVVAPRTISARRGQQASADVPRVIELVSTSDSSRALAPRGENRWSVQAEGSFAVVVALEKGGVPGVATGAARAVIAGDSLFLANVLFDQAANSDLANLAVNWLVNRDTLVGEIGPSTAREYRVVLTDRQLSQLRWLLLGVVPGTVMGIGFLVWLRRRS